MKSLVYILIFVLTIALTKNASAEVTDNIKVNSNYLQNAENRLVPFDGTSHKILYGEKKKGPQVLGALQIDSIDYTDASSINHLFKSSPIAYDPITGAIFVVNSERFVKPGQNLYKNASVRIIHSADGTFWDSTWIFNLDDWFAYNGSISIANYSSVSDYRDIPFIVNTRALEVGSPYLQPKGGLFIPGTIRNVSSDDALLIDGPEKNNPQTAQNWLSMKSKSIIVDNEGYAAFIGSLSPISELYQYGSYGVMTWFFNNNNIVTSDIPNILSDKSFFPSPQLTQSYQAPIEFDFDSDGILYAAVYNFFAGQDPAAGGTRNIAVAKSTDLGNTWSNYNSMPDQLLQNYYNTVPGYTTRGIVDTYEMNAFAVTNSDEYSYFFRVGFLNQGDVNWQEIHLIEAYYKNGAWGIRKVADMNGTIEIINYSSKLSTTGNYISKINTNPLGCELQAVKTEDGQHILLKWIDLTQVFQFASPWTKVSTDYYQGNGVYEERLIEGGVTGAATSDVFSCYRPVNSDVWTQPKNHTTDTMFNKATWLPNIIPDLHNIPMIYSVSVKVDNPQSSLFGIPYVLNMMNADIPTFTIFTRFDADVAGDVKERKEISYINSLKDAYPNPSYDEAQISFELQFGSKISLEIYNILGEKVQVLLDGFYSEGIHTVNADLTKFDNGVYYYTLTAGNQSATKVLNVIK